MITPSRTSATMLSTVCETSVPSRTGNVSRKRPIRRARTIARAGSPRRAGSVADISTPIIVAEVTSRRRSGRRGSAERAIENQAPARKNIEATSARWRPGPRRSPSATALVDDVVDADPLRGEERQPDAERRRRRRARSRRAVRWRPPAAGGRGVERREAARRARGGGRRPATKPTGGRAPLDAGRPARAAARRARRRARPLGDVRPGEALGAERARLAPIARRRSGSR